MRHRQRRPRRNHAPGRSPPPRRSVPGCSSSVTRSPTSRACSATTATAPHRMRRGEAGRCPTWKRSPFTPKSSCVMRAIRSGAPHGCAASLHSSTNARQHRSTASWSASMSAPCRMRRRHSGHWQERRWPCCRCSCRCTSWCAGWSAWKATRSPAPACRRRCSTRPSAMASPTAMPPTPWRSTGPLRFGWQRSTRRWPRGSKHWARRCCSAARTLRLDWRCIAGSSSWSTCRPASKPW